MYYVLDTRTPYTMPRQSHHTTQFALPRTYEREPWWSSHLRALPAFCMGHPSALRFRRLQRSISASTLHNSEHARDAFMRPLVLIRTRGRECVSAGNAARELYPLQETPRLTVLQNCNMNSQAFALSLFYR